MALPLFHSLCLSAAPSLPLTYPLCVSPCVRALQRVLPANYTTRPTARGAVMGEQSDAFSRRLE